MKKYNNIDEIADDVILYIQSLCKMSNIDFYQYRKDLSDSTIESCTNTILLKNDLLKISPITKHILIQEVKFRLTLNLD